MPIEAVLSCGYLVSSKTFLTANRFGRRDKKRQKKKEKEKERERKRQRKKKKEIEIKRERK